MPFVNNQRIGGGRCNDGSARAIDQGDGRPPVVDGLPRYAIASCVAGDGGKGDGQVFGVHPQ